MKTTLSTIALVIALFVPVSSHAYPANYFDYARTPVAPQYTQDPSLDVLPGWPDWIGRLNVFSKYLYGKQYENLSTKQKQTVEKLSKHWPKWIGVPFFLR